MTAKRKHARKITYRIDTEYGTATRTTQNMYTHVVVESAYTQPITGNAIPAGVVSWHGSKVNAEKAIAQYRRWWPKGVVDPRTFDIRDVPQPAN